MSLDGRYDTDNIFAKIIRGEIPSVKVFEDERVLAFMDVFPQSRGHALVISKVSQARNLLEVEPEVLAELAAATQTQAGQFQDYQKLQLELGNFQVDTQLGGGRFIKTYLVAHAEGQ